mmetsp:Transcript_26074/g.30886  ORF Transcript_26074/g.30886 Transcript_26074/m.30886 type:complete len:249 (-) Transcript_26074:136-882(-)
MFNSRCVFVNVYVFRNGANLSSEYGMHTPLILATRHSHRDLVIMLLDAGVDIDGVDGSGHTALHIAAEEGLVSMMELLLDKGAAVDCLNAHGATPLHLATHALKLASIQVLMAYGASATRRDLHGRNPSEMVPALPETRNNATMKDAEDNASSKQERTDILRLLGSHEQDDNTQTDDNTQSSLASKTVVVTEIRPKRDRSTVPQIPAATLHLTRAEQRSLTRNKDPLQAASKQSTRLPTERETPLESN